MNGEAAVEPPSAKPERQEGREAENDMDVDRAPATTTTTTTTSTDSRPDSISKEHVAPMAAAAPQHQQPPREQPAPMAAKEKPPKQEEAVPAPGKAKPSAGPVQDEVEAGVRLLRGHEAEVCFGVCFVFCCYTRMSTITRPRWIASY